MKQKKPRILLPLLMLFCSLSASAYDFIVDGIAYWIDKFYGPEENLTVAIVTRGGSYTGSVTIPPTVRHYAYNVTYPVVEIDRNAFFNCSGLTSVTIPNSVIYIGDHAFYGCSGLTSVTIPNSVTTIGEYAFHNCSGLTSIVVEEGNTVYDSRNNCNAIIETSSNTLIKGCQNTVIPNSVTTIGKYAFYNCSGPTNVIIPNSVTTICPWAFTNCSGLTSVTIGNSVTSIYSHTFADCSGLTSVTIPNSVTVIYERAFDYCHMTNVTCHAEVPPIMNGPWCFIDYSGELYVPKQSIEAYKTADWWYYFDTILPIEAFVAGDVNGDDNVNITDLSDLIDLLLSGNVSADIYACADVDNDGVVTISDVAALIDYLLTGQWP